jgi:hypothetical protein
MKNLVIPVLAVVSSMTCYPQEILNAIAVSMPFLNLTTNAQIGAIGEIAAVSDSLYPDAGMIQNPALLSKNTLCIGGNTSFMPLHREYWSNSPSLLKRLIGEIYLAENNMYGAINKKNALGYRFVLFRLGGVIMHDEYGSLISESDAYEYFHQVTYSHTFNEHLSAGAGIKYIKSKLEYYYISDMPDRNSANAFALDLGIHYETSYNLAENMVVQINAGAALDNFGTKVHYSGIVSPNYQFLPTNLIAGLMVNPEWKFSDKVVLNANIAYQAEKLLVPSPTVIYIDNNGDTIRKGGDVDVSVFTALYSSFYDAPGGFKEEMHEILHKIGSEIRLDINPKFYVAMRAGRFMEHRTKGNRNYTTLGMGLGYFGFSLDSKYIIASGSSPLDKTWAITFGYSTLLHIMKK